MRRVPERAVAVTAYDGVFVGEADADGLGEVEHVGDFGPGVGVPLGFEGFGYVAGAVFYEFVSSAISIIAIRK